MKFDENPFNGSRAVTRGQTDGRMQGCGRT